MSDAFIGEIRMFGGNFAPRDWAFCNGQATSISQNDALYALIGTTYGGDGQTTFNLPDLRGRLPVCQGQGAGLGGYTLGQQGGTETVTLLPSQMPAHNHHLTANTNPASLVANPAGQVFAKTPTGATGLSAYNATAATPVSLAAGVIGNAGSGQPHDNTMPALCVSFIIALFGVFPSRN